jgi:hypothetical protein
MPVTFLSIFALEHVIVRFLMLSALGAFTRGVLVTLAAVGVGDAVGVGVRAWAEFAGAVTSGFRFRGVGSTF